MAKKPRSKQKTTISVETPNKNESVSEKTTKEEENHKGKKKIWSFDLLLEAMKPTSEEIEYRNEKSKELNSFLKNRKLFKCTKCRKNLKRSIQERKKIPVHPCLGVLMCDPCREFYEDGEFSVDSDGEDKYCRWCGEGGTICTCSACVSGFCRKCIKLHFSLSYFKKVQKDENWLCFFCDPKPLWFQRYICSIALQKCEKKEPKVSLPTPEADDTDGRNIDTCSVNRPKRQYKYSSSSDGTDIEAPKSPLKKFKLSTTPLNILINEMEVSSENSKAEVLHELQKLLKSSEYQMSFGVKWCQDILKKLSKPDSEVTQKGLLDECRKIKLVLSVLSTYLVQLCNSVDSIEKTIGQEDGQEFSSDLAEKHQSPYTTVLQFLDFVSQQVKTFVQKGISFSEILEAPVYEDDKVIGLKKKSSWGKKKVESADSKSDVPNKESKVFESKEDIELSGSSDISELVNDQTDQSSVAGSGNSSPCVIDVERITSKTTDSAQDIEKLLLILENP